MLAPNSLRGLSSEQTPILSGRAGRCGLGGFGLKPVLALLAEPICAVGHGVAALCCATSEDRSWVFQGYSVTGVSARGWGPWGGVEAPGGAAVVGLVRAQTPAQSRGLGAGAPWGLVLCPTLDPELACLDFSGGPMS